MGVKCRVWTSWETILQKFDFYKRPKFSTHYKYFLFVLMKGNVLICGAETGEYLTMFHNFCTTIDKIDKWSNPQNTVAGKSKWTIWMTWFSALIGHKMWSYLHLSHEYNHNVLRTHDSCNLSCIYRTLPLNIQSAVETLSKPIDSITDWTFFGSYNLE